MSNLRLSAGMLLTVWVLACVPEAPGSPIVSIAEMDSPAGPSSGEPFLSSAGERSYLSWLEEVGDGWHELRIALLGPTGWTEPSTIARSQRFFVNWADFPSVNVSEDGVLWAHWLERGGEGTYDYGVRVVRSEDGADSWSEPWTPHEDATPTEHGFVSMLPSPEGVDLVWLDGRQSAPGPDGRPPTQEMTLRFRRWGVDGTAGPETLLDARTCDCCQTAIAQTSAGPVVVYRDRSPAEIRDIYVTRLVDGSWTEGVPVHEDGWEISGCPVNGPALRARGDQVVVTWFSAQGEVPRVKVAFSVDAGASFGVPVVVDDGNPSGRVDALLLGDGSAFVTWLERTGAGAAEVRARRIAPSGEASGSFTLAGSSEERASGFPRIVEAADGSILLARTDVSGGESRVRVTRMELAGP